MDRQGTSKWNIKWTTKRTTTWTVEETLIIVGGGSMRGECDGSRVSSAGVILVTIDVILLDVCRFWFILVDVGSF